MTWKKYFKTYDGIARQVETGPASNNASSSKYSSWLPEVYMDNPIEPKDMVNMTKWTWILRLMRH